MRPRLLALALTAALTLLLALAPLASAATESEGYLELSDGTQLRYTLLLPDGDGPFPTVLQYSGYNNGNNAYDGTFGRTVDQLIAEGVAIIGVNLRGSGCSEGTFSPFSEQWADDGVEVVAWIAAQDWSDGNVAMAGVSYPAILSTVTAVEQPANLVAIMPSVPVIDLYPDVGWPGGIWNTTFASVWTVIQKYGTLFGVQETAEGDLACPLVWPTQNDPNDLTGIQAATNPYKDSLDRYTTFLQPEDLARIEVPALYYTAWQDEQLGSRAMFAYEYLDPETSWIVASNGNHIGFAGSDWYRDVMVRFATHFLRGGAPEDFAMPRFQVARETTLDGSTFTELDAYDTYPAPTVTTTLYATGDGALALEPPAAPTALTYNYPQPAPSVFVGIDPNIGIPYPEVYEETYKVPVAPGGAVTFTTPPLAENVQVHGPLSFDVWLSSTADDTDLQVTITEVRPDGNELYVQRGWLRASHQVLDDTLSTPTRPEHTHLEADATPLVPGAVTPLRVQVWPVDQVFRAGSSLRVSLEAPMGFTGFRQLDLLTTPAQNTVHIGPETPTRLVFGRIAAPSVTTDHPACDTLVNQPCRPNPEPVPAGSLTLAPAEEPGAAPAPDESPATPLPATGGGLVVLGLGVVAIATTARRYR